MYDMMNLYQLQYLVSKFYDGL